MVALFELGARRTPILLVFWPKTWVFGLQVTLQVTVNRPGKPVGAFCGLGDILPSPDARRARPAASLRLARSGKPPAVPWRGPPGEQTKEWALPGSAAVYTGASG